VVHFCERQRLEDLGQRHRVLDGVWEHQRGSATRVTREQTPVERRVDLELFGAEHELDPLGRLGVGDVVAAALEAEEPVARDRPRGALDDEVGGRRQPEQRRAIAFGPGGDDLAVGAVDALAGDVVVPGAPGGVGLRIASEAVAPEQPLADVGDVGFNLALGLRPVGPTQPQPKAVMVRRGERLGMKQPLAERDLAPDMAADDGLGAVIEQLARDAAEVPEPRRGLGEDRNPAECCQ